MCKKNIVETGAYLLNFVKENASLLLTSTTLGSAAGAMLGHFIATLPNTTEYSTFDDEITGAFGYEEPSSNYQRTVTLTSAFGALLFTSVASYLKSEDAAADISFKKV